MSVIRVNKNTSYTVMSNTHLREKTMSLKAKGLLSQMLSLPKNWDYSVEGLCTLSKDGYDGINQALKELERHGYLVRKRVVDKKGRFVGYEYNIFEEPQWEKPSTEKPSTEKPSTEKPSTEKPSTEKPATNKILKNKILNNKLLTNERVGERFGEYGNVVLSRAKYQKLIEDFPKLADQYISRLSEYLQQHQSKSYDDHNCVIRSWIKADLKKQQTEHQGTFETDSFFEAAVRRSLGEATGED